MDIRNFVIIAHIDHGKSTLADRMLEVTGTVEMRKMRAQYLDQLDLERERGITIKMAPVRMKWKDVTLNLIDTPGHSDFSYEVSRALQAVEGAVLLVDATKGIQAQTLSNLRAAKAAGLTMIGAVNKVDMNPAHLDDTIIALAELLDQDPSDIYKISGKTGVGVPEILDAVIERVPPAETKAGSLAALIFDSRYDDHRGILAFVRVESGQIKAGDDVVLAATGAKVKVKEVGSFSPQLTPLPLLEVGQIGYVATGLKDTGVVRIGDTIVAPSAPHAALPGYRQPEPVVFIAFYPDDTTSFDDLERALAKLRLNDAALSVSPDANEALGRGLKVGFLGQLHFEITAGRLEREFGLSVLTSFPSIAYRVKTEGGEMKIITQGDEWPANVQQAWQPMIALEIIAPPEYVNAVSQVGARYDMETLAFENIAESVLINARMPLSELIRDFDDQLKSVTAGYASFTYEPDGEDVASLVKLEILLAGDVEPALTRIVPKKDAEREGRNMTEKLKELLPKLQFSQAIQARVDSKIVARETIAAMKKDVTGYLYGGDRSRKMKLWKKQQEGKKRLKSSGTVSVPIEVFREILKK